MNDNIPPAPKMTDAQQEICDGAKLMLKDAFRDHGILGVAAMLTGVTAALGTLVGEQEANEILAGLRRKVDAMKERG